jgi:hypothetical protein
MADRISVCRSPRLSNVKFPAPVWMTIPHFSAASVEAGAGA